MTNQSLLKLADVDTGLRLYEIPGIYTEIAQRIARQGGECSRDDVALLDAIEATLEDKVEAICQLHAIAQAEAKYFEAERTRLQKRETAAKARAASMHRYLHATLTAMNRPRVEGRTFTAALQKNSTPRIRYQGRPDNLPACFRNKNGTLDQQKAREAHQHGCLPEEDFSVDYETHLRIT